MVSLSEKVRKQNAGTSPLARCRERKPYKEYSERQKRRLKRNRAQNCEHSLTWLEREGFISTSLQVLNQDNGKVETIPLNKSESVSLFGATEDMPEQDVDVLNMILYVKDYYNVCGDAYHELALICKQLPRQYKT